MKITITEMDNGWLVYVDRHPNTDNPSSVVFAYGENGCKPTTIQTGVDLLWELINLLDLRGGRYDKERAMAGIEQGDKHEG